MQSRMTNQRRKILEYLKRVKTHPTAEMIYKDVSKELPDITLATVYRNLNHLAEQGEIQKFDVNSKSHFDGDMGFHQHCICSSCGHIKDVFGDRINKETLKKARTKGFEPRIVNILIYGICKKCK